MFNRKILLLPHALIRTIRRLMGWSGGPAVLLWRRNQAWNAVELERPLTTRRRAVRLSIALSMTGVFFLISVYFRDWLGPNIFSVMFPAIVLCAQIGGGLGGVVSTVSLAFAAAYYHLPPAGFRVHDPADLFRLGMFTLSGMLVAWLFAELKRNHSITTTLLANVPDAMIVVNQTGQIVQANRMAENLTGYSREQLLGISVDALFPPRAAERHGQLCESFFKNPKTRPMGVGLDLSLFQRDGCELPVEISLSPFFAASGTLVLYLVRDATERYRENKLRAERDQIQQELLESKQRFETFFHLLPEGFAIRTLADGRYLEANDTLLNMLGYERGELVGKTVADLGIWHREEELQAMMDNLQRDAHVRGFEATFRAKSGALRQLKLSAERIQLKGEECLLTITRDVTDLKSLEQQLRQAQKMEAVGRLAGGVAHDFNNILGVILGYSELLLESSKNEDIQRTHVEQIRKAAQRAASLTRQLLAFSRKQILQPRVLNLNAVFEGSSNMLKRIIGEDIELVYLPGSPLGSVKADQGQIEQIAMNLAVNACDAMPRGGKLIIETADCELDETYAALHLPVRPGSYVMLSVSDTGCGMDEATMSQIFEPFFTTKELGKGTGLGLAIVYGVVKQSEGYIWVYSEPGKGTTFKIYLPRVSETPAATEERSAQEVLTGGSETILLVEDDDALRQLAGSVLRESGYTLLEAEGPQTAIEIANRPNTTLDLLLTDMVMPGMNGIDLAEALRKSRPQLGVLYMSGYPGDRIKNIGLVETESLFLEKPFSRKVLLAKVRDTLHSSKR